MRTLRHLLVLTAVSALLCGLPAESEAQSERQTPAAPDPRPGRSREELEIVQRPGRVREMARLKGNAVIRESLPDLVQLDVAGLVKESDIVIVGIPETNVCRMTENGFTIRTIYSVSVQDALKGDLALGQRVTVALPGGMVQFEDGSRTQVRIPGFRPMENGRKYLLFLIQHQGKYFLTAGNGNALFEIDASGKLRSHAGRTDKMSEQTGRDAEDFLAEVRSNVEAQNSASSTD